MAKAAALLTVGSVVALIFLGFFDVIEGEEIAKFFQMYAWLFGPLIVGVFVIVVGIALDLQRELRRSRQLTPYSGCPPEGERKDTTMGRVVPVLVLIFAVPLMAACATYPPAQPSNPRPPIIFNPPREAGAGEAKLPPADAANPCGVPDVIARFMREGMEQKGPKGVSNNGMPMEIEPVVNDWVRCVGGKIVYTYNAPMRIDWIAKVQQIPNSVYGSDGTIGGFVASRLVGAAVGVMEGFTVNGRSVFGSGYNNATAERVTVYLKLTGVNDAGQPQLAFQGEGRADYDPYSRSYNRDWGFRRAALFALRNMH